MGRDQGSAFVGREGRDGCVNGVEARKRHMNGEECRDRHLRGERLGMGI